MPHMQTQLPPSRNNRPGMLRPSSPLSAPPCAVAEEGDTRLVNGSSIPGMAWGRLEVRGATEDGSKTWGTMCGYFYSVTCNL